MLLMNWGPDFTDPDANGTPFSNYEAKSLAWRNSWNDPQAIELSKQAAIELDPVFLETVTVDADHPLLVQVTLTSDCRGVFVAEKSPHGFTVKELMGGRSNATFDWEVAAKRKGYEDQRLEPFSPAPF